MGRWAVEFAQFSLKIFNDIVLGNKSYVDLILGDIYTHRTYYMGLVDPNNKINFYDGKVRVVDPDGKEFVKYEPKDYVQHIAEHVEPWTYLKFPYLKNVGWKGLVDGKDSGIYMATPLSRLNASDGMATPLAQAEYERFYATLGGKPVHQRLAFSIGPASSKCYTQQSAGWSWLRILRSPHPISIPSRPKNPPRASASLKLPVAHSPTTTPPTSAAF